MCVLLEPEEVDDPEDVVLLLLVTEVLSDELKLCEEDWLDESEVDEEREEDEVEEELVVVEEEEFELCDESTDPDEDEETEEAEPERPAVAILPQKINNKQKSFTLQ